MSPFLYLGFIIAAILMAACWGFALRRIEIHTRAKELDQKIRESKKQVDENLREAQETGVGMAGYSGGTSDYEFVPKRAMRG